MDLTSYVTQSYDLATIPAGQLPLPAEEPAWLVASNGAAVYVRTTRHEDILATHRASLEELEAAYQEQWEDSWRRWVGISDLDDIETQIDGVWHQLCDAEEQVERINGEEDARFFAELPFLAIKLPSDAHLQLRRLTVCDGCEQEELTSHVDGAWLCALCVELEERHVEA